MKSNSFISSYSAAQLRRAATLREKIDALEGKLAKILGGAPAASPKAPAGPGKRRKISAAGRARIAAAQRARWAKLKASKK